MWSSLAARSRRLRPNVCSRRCFKPSYLFVSGGAASVSSKRLAVAWFSEATTYRYVRMYKDGKRTETIKYHL